MTVLVLSASLVGCVGFEISSFSSFTCGGSTSTSQTTVQTSEHNAQVSQPTIADGRVGVSWSSTFGTGLSKLSFVFSWDRQANEFEIEVETPDGSVQTFEKPSELDASRSISGTVTLAGPGAYAFHPTANGPVAPDSLDLQLRSTFSGPATETVDTVEVNRSDVTFEEHGGGYRATVTYEDAAPANRTMELDLDTGNGDLWLGSGSQEAELELVAWAEAETKQEAFERLGQMAISYGVTADRMHALATPPESTCGSVGADLTATVPSSTTVHGLADTSNGPITLDGPTVDGFEMDTSNGEISGAFSGQGEILADTSNGRIDVAFTPTGTTELDVDTSNGEILLGLLEGSQIGYELDADTSNGQISEQMDEASLDGEEDEGTLRTSGFDGRQVQVTGVVDTSNGDIQFEGR